LGIIHRILSDDGTLFIHIDDNELGYLIALSDEVFGRKNRISIVTFKQGSATGHKTINPGVVSTSNFVLIYAKEKALWKPNRLYSEREERDKRYGQFILNAGDEYQKWRFGTLSGAFAHSLGLQEKGLSRLLKKGKSDSV
jgi:adenine-specific DNA-methyltransferase